MFGLAATGSDDYVSALSLTHLAACAVRYARCLFVLCVALVTIISVFNKKLLVFELLLLAVAHHFIVFRCFVDEDGRGSQFAARFVPRQLESLACCSAAGLLLLCFSACSSFILLVVFC